MTDAELLVCLKVNLRISSSAYDAFLGNLLSVAKKEIAREGITLDLNDIEDCGLVWRYASFLFEKDKEGNGEMKKDLRLSLNNRLFSEKAGAVDG